MGIDQITCHVVVCDTCHQPVDYDDGIPHFTSREQALAQLRGDPDLPICEDGQLGTLDATRHPDGTIECYECLAPKLCSTLGHRFGEGHRCRCAEPFDGGPARPRIPEHRVTGCPETWWCTRPYCHEKQDRPILTLIPGGGR